MKKPILLDYVVSRTEDNKKLYQYNYTHDMSVLVEDESKLFIEYDVTNCAMQTKTKVRSESDDEDFRLMELATKTDAVRESDDEDWSLMELLSKTEVGRERDEEEYTLYELISKTFTDRESDDEDDYYLN